MPGENQTTITGLKKGRVTASNFKLECSSTDEFENKARNMILRSHWFRHRQCKLSVPCLVLCTDDPCSLLGCSSDGNIDCRMCGRFLLEVKCSVKFKGFYSRTALKMSSICVQNNDGTLILKTSLPYYYQIQGQMAVRDISKCVLVFYTHKGIHCVDIDFNDDFWKQCRVKLMLFYTQR